MSILDEKQSAPQVKITPEMMKNFKILTCDCGGKVFKHGVIIKMIPSLLSPSGKEEAYPFDVLVCTQCNKIPSEIDNQLKNILPEEVIAKRKLSKEDF